MKNYFWTGIFFLFVWELFSVLPSRRDAAAPVDSSALHTLSGIIHVHSRYSDGGGTVPEIAEAAGKAGLDFVVLTDHNTSRARKDGFEHRYGNVDLFVEMEASTPAGHCVTFYSHTPARELSDEVMNHLSWEHFLGTDTRPGMFIAVAHPSNLKNPWNRLDKFPDGMEVFNFDSMWQRQLYESLPNFALTVVTYPFNNFLAALNFFQIYQKDFVAWDNMNTLSPGRFAYLAHDTHSRLKLNSERALPWPDYLQSFRLASNVVFSKSSWPADFEARKKMLYGALHAGHNAMAFHSIFPFVGNEWRVQCNDERYYSGDHLTFRSGGQCEFVVEVPPDLPYERSIRLYKQGEMVKEIKGLTPTVKIPLEGPGAYRVEVWVKMHTAFRLLLNREVPYLFYNTIYVR